ncbi:hypothetical protein JW992_04520 [candidate division KSB1 bacterium]|nr:hypothetical protein [candidate division KSB1 bacterium]
MTALVFALSAGGCFALLGLTYKLAHHWHCRVPVFTLIFTLTAGIIALGGSDVHAREWNSVSLWVLGGAMGLFLAGAIALVNLTNRLGPAYISWTVINLSLLLPIFISALFLREPLTPADLLTLLLFVLMLVFFNRGLIGLQRAPQSLPWRYAFFLIGMWALNGLFLFGNKLKYDLFGETGSAELAAVFYGSGSAAVFLFSVVTRQKLWPVRREWVAGIAAGTASAAGILLMQAAMSLPAATAFPLVQGMSLVGGALVTGLVFRESINRWMLFGLSCGVAVLILAIYRDRLVF